MRGYRLWLLPVTACFIIACFVIVSTGCGQSNQGTSATQLSASDQQMREQASKQAEINVRSAQINGSNLPPEQKKQLLDQLQSGGGK